MNSSVNVSTQHNRTERPPSVPKKIWTRICDLFKPEEVEVTFKKEGNTITYTYVKVESK